MTKLKKLLASTLLGLLVLAPAMAQQDLNGPAGTAHPVQSAYYSSAQGMPQLGLNATGSNYGQVGNASASAWYLGFNTVMTSIGTQVLNWNASAQVVINAASNALGAGNVFQVNAPAANNGEYFLAYLTNGWIELHALAADTATLKASVPTIASCGSSPSVASGTDVAGDVTVGSSPSNSCSIVFASQPSSIPHCVANDATTAGVVVQITSLSRNGFTMKSTAVNGSPILANDRLDWLCLSHQ